MNYTNPAASSKTVVSYTLTLTDQERQEIARTLSRLVNALLNCRPVLESAEVIAANSQMAVSAATTVPQPAPRDRWANDKPAPDAETYTVRVWKCEQQTGKRGPFLDVRWDQRRAYCHDQKLFPWILEASKTRRQIVLYLKQNGNFHTIVGVKA